MTAKSPLTNTNCTSCHARPPSGTSFPNVAGRHGEHNALSGVTGVCATCHTIAPSATDNTHYNHANARPGKNALRVSPGEAVVHAAYDARSGAASFNATALTCSNVSCHGGQTTPNWQTGTLDVNTQCTNCHVRGTSAGTPQYNSPYSGEHDRSNHVSAGCTACHNTTKLADPAVGKHFLNLGTPALETRASVTIGGTGTQIPEGSYTPGATVGTGSCDPSCHGRENW
ncbi:MAG: CxxxxCH/CxxCH domain-containing protein [Deltaproteobacteria bacterium]|nr:CxxxxCH/CxxCH domain-containing protein [Deltaproteobacteria bacterium]